MRTPTAFISYSWDDDAHKDWVKLLASKLRADGVDVALDRWAIAPGDQLPKFMESSVRESDFVLIVCTPKYKSRSDKRQGGVGYEGDIMTGEVFVGKDPRKFVPILRFGDWENSSPSWLVGKYGLDFRGEQWSQDAYRDLLSTLHDTREKAPPIGPRPATPTPTQPGCDPPNAIPSDAAAILIAAARESGVIVAFEADGGLYVLAGDQSFAKPGDPRSEAKIRDCLERLQGAGLVEGDFRSPLKVTQKGFDYVDNLESQKAIESPSAL